MRTGSGVRSVDGWGVAVGGMVCAERSLKTAVHGAAGLAVISKSDECLRPAAEDAASDAERPAGGGRRLRASPNCGDPCLDVRGETAWSRQASVKTMGLCGQRVRLGLGAWRPRSGRHRGREHAIAIRQEGPGALWVACAWAVWGRGCASRPIGGHGITDNSPARGVSGVRKENRARSRKLVSLCWAGS